MTAMRKTIFLLAFLSAIITYGQAVGIDGQDVTTGTIKIKIETTLGDIVVRLYDATPIHRDNFVKLVKEGYYDGTLFHRVIKNFMIQGGNPNSKNVPADKPLGGANPGYTLEPEFRKGLYHKRGALAAAREGDETNPERRSSGSQFYIVWGRTFSPRQMEYLADKMKAERHGPEGWTEEQQNIYATVGGSPHLDGQYTVFGEVEEGLSVVEKIQSTPTGPDDRPLENIEVKMTVIE